MTSQDTLKKTASEPTKRLLTAKKSCGVLLKKYNFLGPWVASQQTLMIWQIWQTTLEGPYLVHSLGTMNSYRF